MFDKFRKRREQNEREAAQRETEAKSLGDEYQRQWVEVYASVKPMVTRVLQEFGKAYWGDNNFRLSESYGSWEIKNELAYFEIHLGAEDIKSYTGGKVHFYFFSLDGFDSPEGYRKLDSLKSDGTSQSDIIKLMESLGERGPGYHPNTGTMG